MKTLPRLALCSLAAGLVFSVTAQSAGLAHLPKGASTHRDLAYVSDGHERQKLNLYLPQDGRNPPIIITIHGGACKGGNEEQDVPLE
jgi:acetyl esterase/lipase